MSRRTERVLLALLLAAVALFHGLTLRPGFDWGGDWAQYLEHARNLAEGRPYAALNYLHNPGASPSAPVYPPVYPLLLAPLVKAFGLGLVPFQLQSIAFLLLFLWLFYRTWRPHVSPAPLLAAMAAFALHPYLWGCKDLLLSEFPFLCFAQGALWALDRCPERGGARRGTAAGLLLGLAAGTRAAGLALVPLPLLYSLWKFRRFPVWSWTAVGAAGGGVGILAALFGAFWNYGEFLHPSYDAVVHNGVYAAQWLAQLLAGPPAIVRPPMGLIVVLVSVLGFLVAVKRRTPHETYLLLLVAPLLIYPSDQGLRYLLPMLPYLFFVLALGADGYAATRGGRVVVPVVGLCFLWVYGSVYARTDLRAPVPGSVDAASTAELLKALEEHTEPGAVFATTKPRALALLVRRHAVFLPLEDAGALGALDRFRVSFVLTSPAWPSDRARILPFIQRHQERFRPVFKNNDFLLFAVAAPARGREASETPTTTGPIE
jgi:hypothetical protein